MSFGAGRIEFDGAVEALSGRFQLAFFGQNHAQIKTDFQIGFVQCGGPLPFTNGQIEASLFAILSARLVVTFEVLSAPERLQRNDFGAAGVRWADVLFHRATFHPL